MKKIVLIFLLIIPLFSIGQGIKVKDLPTTTTGTSNDFLIKDYYTGTSGSTQKISVQNFIDTYISNSFLAIPSTYTTVIAATDTFYIRKTSNGTYYKVPYSSVYPTLTGTSPIIVNTNTISITDAAADGSTKGAASFTANDFNSSSGNISIDYANGDTASSSQHGFMSSYTYNNLLSQWTTTGSDIYYNTGNVGIGNSSPDAKIDVVSTSTVNPVASFSVNTSGSTNATGVNINAEGGTTTDALVVNSKSNVSGGINNSIVALATTANGGYNNPFTSIAQNGDYNYGAKVIAQGGVDAVGLSISASGASGNNNAIDITAGNFKYTPGSEGAGKILTSDANGVASWQTPSAGGSASVTITDDNSTNATMYPTWVAANSGSQPVKVSSTKMKWNPSGGFLGIGITPDTNLHVNGKIKLTNDLIFDEPNSTATNRGFSISTRDIAVDYPAISFRPRTNNTVCALDIMPRGTSVTENTGNGFAWVDVCSADILNNNNSINSARVGVRSDRIEFGSKIFNGATARALVLSVQTSAGTVVPSLWIDNTGKKIGLNTTSPNWSLQVHQDVGGESSVSSFTNVNTGSAITDGLNVGVDATGNGFLLLRENLKLSFWTNATERMNISSSGHLLFNTDNTLDIGASGATRPRSIYAGTSSVSPLIIGGSGTTQSLTYKTTSGVGTTGADHIFQVGNNGATEAMRILNSGLVGIGTSSPQSKLDVEGGVAIGAAYSGTTAAPTNGLIVQGDAAIGATSTTAKLQVTDANRSGNGAAISATVTNTVSVSSNTGINSVVSTTGSSTDNYAFRGVASGATNNYGILGEANNSATTNYGGYFMAQGATNNYGLVVQEGYVGIGTTTPTELFQVSGTASVSITSDGRIIQNGLITYDQLVSVADDGTFDIPSGTTGWCEVIAGVSSTIDGAIAFRFTNDGAVLETRVADAIASSTTDTDTKLCAFDNGSNVRIKNRLGGTRDLLIKLTYR